MTIRIDWTNQVQALRLIETWLIKHNCYSGEMAQQDDDCTLDAIDLVGELADLLVKVVDK